MYSDSKLPQLQGSVLAGKYRVERTLGVGGMGFVVAAHHEQLNRRVALKFLLPSCAPNPEAAARFQREARAAARIHSEHVVRILDVGELDDIGPYMVMEYLEGQDLAGVLQKRGSLSIHESTEYLLQACEAVAEAHAAGIVHRDLKPANLFLTQHADGAPLVKVCDFGIAKAAGIEAQGLTFTNAFVGSPSYSAPEQLLASSSVDARADIWALGVILFELLSGQLPFTGRSVAELASNILNVRAPDIRNLRPEVPESLAVLLAGCLERDPDRRLPNVGVLAHALLQFAPASAQLSARRISRVLGLDENNNSFQSFAPAPGAVPSRTSVGSGETLAAATERAPTPAFAPSGTATEMPQSISVAVAQDSKPLARKVLILGVGLLAISVIAVGLALRGRDDAQVPATRSEASSIPNLPSAAEIRKLDSVDTAAVPEQTPASDRAGEDTAPAASSSALGGATSPHASASSAPSVLPIGDSAPGQRGRRRPPRPNGTPLPTRGDTLPNVTPRATSDSETNPLDMNLK